VEVRILLYKVYSYLQTLLKAYGFYNIFTSFSNLGYATPENNKVLMASVVQLPYNTQSEFYKWFVGFCDAEGSFWFQPVMGSDSIILKVTWVFSIELHKDDLNVLEFIRNNLGIGNIRLYKNKCVYTVSNIEGTYLLISIFDKYNLNSTKYLDYLKYKEAFLTYIKRNELGKQLSK
jgi:hypothetical protein